LSSLGPNHSYTAYTAVLPFEAEFDPWAAQGWVHKHWIPLCAWAGSLYIILVFSGQAWMASRPPFDLRGPLAVWSGALAVFSILGFSRTLPELLHSLTSGGIYRSVCDPGFLESNKISSYWTWVFTVSKLAELGDTAFIVLRKQQLIFLHWYHHLTVLIYVFFCFSEFTSSGRWFMVMNYFVHSLMYSYYALRALRVRVPRVAAMTITSLQLLQMVVGCAVTVRVFLYKQQGVDCSVSDANLTYGFLMYASYFVLFARFFYNAYFAKSGKKSNKKEEEGTMDGHRKDRQESVGLGSSSGGDTVHRRKGTLTYTGEGDTSGTEGNM